MPISLTAEQIVALAPDPGSAKAGKGLATPRKWVSLGASERAAWGECQGSAKTPYQTQVDLSDMSFRCSCPSRKFPCKHGLGLLLLLESQPAEFSQAEPAWVTEWLAGRTQRAAKRAAKAERPGVTDEEAQAKRIAERQAKITAGLQDLERWLRDLVRQGLAAVQGRPNSFWDTTAARMVDAQAPGIARLVRELAGVAASGAGWQGRMLEQLGRLHLLIEGFKRLDTLAPATQADIRAALGWPQSQEELLAGPGTRDRWLVLGQHVEEENDIRTQRTWLWGAASARAALILDFAHASQPLDKGLVPGTCLDAELVFFPGAYPLRALVKQRNGSPIPLDDLPGFAGSSAATAAYAGALALNPWLERFPLALRDVVPAPAGDGWIVRDASSQVLAITPRFERGWHALALSGGHPLALFGEWDGECLLPLSAWAEGRFVLLSGEG